MQIVRKSNLSRVTPLYFRKNYGLKFVKIKTLPVKEDVLLPEPGFVLKTVKSKKKNKKKVKAVKIPKIGFRFLFNKNIYIPPFFSRRRVSVYNGKSFFSFMVKTKYVYTRLAEFVSTKRFGQSIHKKAQKSKTLKKKK